METKSLLTIEQTLERINKMIAAKKGYLEFAIRLKDENAIVRLRIEINMLEQIKLFIEGKKDEDLNDK